jgi:hypothetical protein
MSKALFKLKRRNAAVGGGGGTFTVNASGYGDTYNNAYVPILLDRLAARSLNPTKVESAINLQEEMALPHSPPCTSFLVGGTDASKFEQGSAAGTIELTASARSTLTPGQTLSVTVTPNRSGVGTGAPATLSIYIPAVADQYFVDYGVSTNSGSHGAWGDPMKYMPGTADYGGSAKTFTAGQVVFFKAGVHRTALVANKSFTSTFSSRMGHHGSAGDPVILELCGWGGRAQILGDDVVTGGVTPAQATVAGNANYASLKEFDLTSQGGALQPFQGVYDGDALTANSKLYRTQWPTPANLGQSRLPDPFRTQGTERYGMRNLPCKSSGGTSRMYTDGGADSNGFPAAGGTTITLVDPGFSAHYGDVSVSTFQKIMILIPGNYLAELTPTTYNYATSTLTFTSNLAIGVKDIGGGNGICAYAVLHHPLDIVQAGQYASSSDGLKFWMWPTNNSTVSVSRRFSGVDWGMGGYVKVSGGVIGRFCCGTNRSAVTSNGGTAFHFYGSNEYKYEADIIGVWIRQCFADDGAIIYGQNGGSANTTGLKDSNVELNLFTENEANGLRFSCTFDGDPSSTTYAGLVAYGRGKIRGNSCPELGINQTFLLFQGSRGVHITLNNNRGNSHLHGNVFSLYDGAQVNRYFAADYNDVVNSSRGFTSDNVTASRHAFYRGNFVLMADDSGFGQNSGINLFGGEIGGELWQNLCMSFVDNGYWQAVSIPGTSNSLNFHNNVCGAMSVSTGWTGAINDNLFTNESQFATDPITLGGTHTGNQNYIGGSQIYAFTGFNADMISKLGSGVRVGVFRKAV